MTATDCGVRPEVREYGEPVVAVRVAEPTMKPDRVSVVWLTT